MTHGVLDVQGKICPACKIYKFAIDYYRRNRANDGLHIYCRLCTDTKNLAYRVKNREKINKVSNSRYYGKKEEILALQKLYYERNKSIILEKQRQRVAGKNKTELAAYNNAYYYKNRGKELERRYRRKKRIKGPDWLTPAERAEIEGLYLFCRIFKGFEVDHIIPLNAKRVSGLHVPSNLQILPIRANRQKRNEWIGETYG